ncbi:hypothetical protein ACHAXR_011934 [Thalassiosira sp. AJA248-18]
MFGSAPATSPFGAPAPAPFGSPAPAPFGGFGQPAAAPAAGGFGAAPAAPGGFGQTSTFGQPAAAAPSAFGAPATAGAFGQPAPAPSAFGAAPGGFGAAPAPAFGAPAPAAGGLFGGAAPAPAPFGSPAPAAAFGAKPAGGGMFGSAPAPSGGLFGAAPAPAAGGLFGGAPSAAPFGSPAPATPFGGIAAAPAAFGAPAPSAFGAPAPTGAFGAPAAPAAGAFGQPQQTQTGSTVAPYQSSTKQDGTNSIILQAITAMPQYEQKSFEELRLEDYLAGNKGTKGAAAPAPAGFGGFGAAPQPAPAFGQPAPAPAFGAAPAPAGGLFGAPAPAPAAGGLFGAPAPAPAFGAAPAPAFGAAPAPAAGGLFGSAPAAAPTGGLFGAPAPAPAFGAAPAPAAGGLFGAPTPAPAFGAPQPAPAFGAPQPAPAFGAAPAPAAGGLFGAPAPAPAAGGLFGAPAPAPAAGGLFGQPAPAPSLFGQPAPAPASGGLFGASPAKPGGLFGAPAPAAGGLFGAPAPAPAAGGLFGQPPAPAAGGLYGAPLAPAVPAVPPPSAEAVLAQQLAAVENQRKQLELLDAWRGNPPSGSKIIPTSQYADSGNDWNGGGTSYAASSSALLSYRAAPRSTAKIRPRGYTPSKHSPVTGLGMKTGSPILSPNKFVGSATKTLFIKPNSLTPKPKTRLLLTNGGSSDAAALENGDHESPNKSNVPTQELKSPAPTNGSQPKPIDSTSPVSPRAAGSPASPAHDFYRQVVDSTGRSPSASSPLQADKQFIPTLTKAGYNMSPSIVELEAMSEADLAAVTGFKVERPGYGCVAWDGAVDVRGVDIDSVVMIESKNVSVYDEAEEKGEKPQQGSKLNRSAVITMYDIYPKDGAESSTEAKAKLSRKIEKSTKKMGAELLSFDAESGVWKFRVGHFSRYGLDDDSDDDSDDEINATPSLATLDDDQESYEAFGKELGGASKMRAPMDEDESTSAYTDNMSAAETFDQSDAEEETHVQEIVRAGEEAYAMMTEEVLDDYEEEAIVPFETLADEIEEEPVLFPDEMHEEMTPLVKEPIKPTVLPGHSTGICSKLADKCGLKNQSSSNFDFGMRMRRSFRVGWRPDGSFIQLKPSSLGAQVLVQSKPAIAPKSDKESSISLSLMQTHQKHSVKAIENENETPPSLSPQIFTLPRSIASGNESLFNALEDYSRTSAKSSFNSVTQQVVSNSFSLLMCLYGEDKLARGAVDETRRLKAVSTWLKGVVSSDTMQAISSAQSSGDLYGSIFAALSGGDLGRASSLALDSGNPRLSFMLANSGIQAQPFCNNQREMWNQSGAQPFVPTSLLRVYSLASGSVDIERSMYKSGTSYNIDWRRRFGMFLWSASHSQDEATVSSVVKQYGSDVSAGLAPPAIPMYCGNAAKATDQCILYQVLNHYADADASVTHLVSPSSHSPFRHDFSASFHLGSLVTALSTSTLSLHQEDLIVDGVASQLIGEGFWEWAVYASLCFISSGAIPESSAFARRLRAKNIISRFYSPSTDPSAGRRRSFLQSIGIPPQWFGETHAHRCASEGDIFGMVNNLRFSATDSMSAMEDLVIPNMLLEGKESMKKLWQLLESLKSKISDDFIDCWNKPHGCGMIHKFLELHSQVEKLSGMPSDEAKTTVDIQHLLDVASDLETETSKARGSAHNKSSLPFAKIPYGFTRTPWDVVLAEVREMLSLLRLQLLAIQNGQSTHYLDRETHTSSKLAFALAPDGLFDSSTPMGSEGFSAMRGLCGFKAMG